MNARFLAGCIVALASFSAAFAQVTGTALVRHAPNINGTVDGSVQQMSAESVTLNGGAVITGDLLVPGLPTVRLNGQPNYGGTIDGSGSATLTSHQVTLNGNTRLSHVVRRTNAVTLPAVAAPPAPTGTRNVTITAAGQSPGSFATLRNLTLNGGVGQFAIPAGTYGDFIANGGSGFTLGVAGATTPAVYHFQHLTLNGATHVQVVGPVQITVANGFTANGNFGSSNTPGWLALNIYSGPFTLNGGCNLYGYVTAPNSTVTINGNSQLIGGLACDRLTVNGGGLLRLAALVTNAPPTVSLTSPGANVVFTAPATIALQASASDTDGTVTLVEFFAGATKVGQATAAPFQFTWSPVAAGSYSLTARATDNSGATATSAAVPIVVNALPTVALTAPTANQVFTAATNITLQATAADTDGTITKVEFYAGSLRLGEALSAPYQFVWSNAPAGVHSLTAVATDNRNAPATSAAVSIVVNAPPTVSITAPAAGAPFTAPASVAIQVNAVDSDGTVAKVDFYNGASLIGTSATAPFSFTWASVAAGSYSLTAVATDNRGATGTSAAVAVTVSSPNLPPSVVITSPQNGAVVTAPGSFLVAADASDPDGTIAKVEFFQNSTKLGEDFAPPYQFNVSGLAAGSYGFSARATDNAGATATSAIVNVLVNAPPVVALTAPAAGKVFRLGESITLTANASDSDGTIARVEFYRGTTWLGDSTTAPYQFTWTGAAAGAYALTAKAFDNLGAPTTSAVINVIVDTPPAVALTAPANNTVFELGAAIPLTAEASDTDGTVARVEFYADGTLLGEATVAPYVFSWTTASAGTHLLTARAIDNLGIDTTTTANSILVNVPPVVALTEPAHNAGFNSPAGFTLKAEATDTDGAIAKVEFFQGATWLGEATSAPYSYTVSGLAGGSYTFTAKATDNLNAFSVSADVTVHVNASPVVALTTPAAGAVFRPGQSIPLSATASDPDGSIARVEFYQGTTKLGESTGAPHQFNWTGAAAGAYALTAKAFDNLDAPATSAVVNIVVDTPPTVALTTPANNTVFTVGAAISLAAAAADSDGSVAKVEFYAGGTLIGTDTSEPYTLEWTDAAPGAHTLTARAIDNLGVDTTSTAVSVFVNLPPVVALTAPTAGRVYRLGQSILLTAEATDADGSIARVEFYQGTTKLGESTTAPYQYAWNGASAGAYALTAKAFDNLDAPATSAVVNIVVDTPPTVALTAPANNAVFTLGNAIPLTADAADSDGMVTKVEFYADGTLIGQSTTAPHAFSWSTATAGTHVLTARAIDNHGVDTTSASVSILVNVPPAVALTEPANNSVFNSPANIALTAVATDADGTIAKVEFFQGDTKLGEATTAPYRFTTAGFLAGTYTFTAKATDNRNATTVSAPLTVRVSVPPVALAQSIEAKPDTATPIVLTATDADGDALTFAVVDNPLHGSLSGSAPNLIYTPTAGFVGFDVFTFKASDAASSSAPATISITVTQPAPCESAQQILPVGGSASFTSLAGTATLVGWDEYTQVSFPPKKYRKQTSNQFFWHLNSDIRGGCISFPYGSTRIEVVNATSTYSATTGVRTTIGERRYGGNVVHGGSLETLYAGPLTASDSAHEADATKERVIDPIQTGFNPPILTPTSSIKTGVDCFVNNNQNHRYLGGDVRWALSEEDTEVDARARVTPASGTSNTAFRTARTTGFSFSFSEVSYTANFNIPAAGLYHVFYTYALKPHGQASPVTTHVLVQSRTFSAGTQTISGTIDAVLKDTDYTLQSIVVRPPCGAPTATAQTVSVTRNTPKAIVLTGADLDGDPLTFTVVANPTNGSLSGSAPNLTYTPNTGYLGTDSFTFKVNDGVSDSTPATVSITVLPPNNPPRIVSSPTRFHLFRRAYESTEPADVSTWLPLRFSGVESPPVWTIHPDKRGATQETNSDAAALISDIYLQDSTIEGHISVGSAFDDDYIGFVFGYQDATHFYVFDWKQFDQGAGLQGMSVKVVSADTPISSSELDATAGNGSRVRTIFHNSISYDDFAEYRFVLSHRPGDIRITVYRGPTVITTINLTDSTYPAGKFGFYTFSQEKSHYRDVDYIKHITGDYLYQAAAVDDESDAVTFSLPQGPTGMTIDGATGLLRWPAGMIVAGSHPISIKASDAFGFTLQNYTLVVEADNLAPRVNAGFDRSIRTPADALTLLGQVTDDGLPAGQPLAIQWTQISGPGTITFATSQADITAASATAPGTYLVELAATDGVKRTTDLAEIRVAVAAAKAPTGLVAWWPLNGHRQEIVRGNHDFGLFRGAAFDAGKVTQGVRFDGVDDYATVSPHSDLDIGASAAGFTIEMWVKPEEVKYAPLINWHNGQTTNGNGLHLWSNNDTNRISAYLVGTGGSGVISTADGTLTAGVWQHIALTYDKPAGVLRIYKDGFVAATANIGTTFRAQTTYPIFFGRNPQDLPAFNGTLDEVSFYDRALTKDEIRALVAAGADGKSPFDQNTPPTVNAGADFALPAGTTSISLEGSVTDDTRPFGAVATALWTQVSGPSPATFANHTSAQTTATNIVAGTYVFKLTGSDGFLAPVSDLVEVRVGVGTAEPPPGLVAWWPGNGHTRDLVSGAHDVDLLSGATLQAGKVAQGFAFDGVNDYGFVDRYNELDIGGSSTGMTIELWVKPETLTYGPLLHWHNGTTDGPHLWTNTDGRVAAYMVGAGGEVINALGAVEAGVWQHIALTWTKATGVVRIYKNGQLFGTGNVSPGYRPRTDFDLGLGGSGNYTQRFHGTLDEVSLYNRPLAQSELRAIFEAGVDGKSPPDNNTAPFVNAGRDIVLAAPGTATLTGIVNDDNLPFGLPTASWSVVGNPPGVTFGDAASASTTVTFTNPGVYVLKLTGSDRYAAPVSDQLEVRVGAATVAPPAGLAAWWPGNGHAQEVVRGGHDIELFNGAAIAPAKIAQGFAFDGVNDYGVVQAHSDLDIGASAAGFSIELWVKPDTVTYGPLIDWHNGTTYGLEFWTNSDGRLTGYLTGDNGGTVDAPAAGITAGVWQHVVLTYDKSNGAARLYKNGAVVGTATVAGYRARTEYNVYFGRNPKDPQTFVGTLDEISLYTRPLGASEVTSLYNAAGGKTPIVINTAPNVDAGPDRSAYTAAPLALSGSAFDDGEPTPPGALTYQWSKVSGPGGATFSAPTALNSDVTLDAPGSYTLRLAVSDSALTTTDDLVVTVTTPASQPPIVALTQPRQGGAFPAGLPVTLRATASDPDGTIASVEFFRGTTSLGFGTPVPGQSNTYARTATFTLAQSPLSLTARAIDNTGVVVTSAVVSATVVSDPGEPSADLITPAADARISAPTILKGVTAGPVLAAWATEYRLKAAESAPSEPWTLLASGNAPAGTTASPASLGTFDPTRLINGIYELRLTATDAIGQVAEDTITVLVEGNMKIGAFMLAFEDLKVPLAGIPITLTRTYDSRDTRVGDFGPGWRLSLANIRVQKNRNLGAGWYQTILPPGTNDPLFLYFVEPQQERIVTVAMPDGETHRFRGGAYVKNTPPESGYPDNSSQSVPAGRGKYRFYPLGDTTAKLEPLDAANQLAEDFYIGVTGDRTGTQDLTIEDRTSNPGAPAYNVTRFRLTLDDGTVMILDEALGLIEMRDRNDNMLAVNRDAQGRVNGVTATQNAPGGVITRSVLVHRNAAGRVDYIRDLANKTIDYLYDAQGRLTSLTDRELNTTQFRYESAAFPNYLTAIIDPRGITALRTEYDPASGKMIKQIDADGKETIFNHGAGVDVATRFEKVKDRLGNETTLFYDERGNVITRIDPLGAQTTYSYWPDSDWLKFETDHYGNVKSFAYDARGNVTVATLGANPAEDPANPVTGYVTRTVYTASGAPQRITDADGRVQTFVYDPDTDDLLVHTLGADPGNPSVGDKTVNTYNDDGTVATSTDALGNVTTHTYDYAFSDGLYPGAVRRETTTLSDPAGAAGSDPGNASVTVLRRVQTLFDAQENEVATIVERTRADGSKENVVTRHYYNAEDQRIATVLPDGRVTETRHTSFGREDRQLLWSSFADYQSRDDARARVTSHAYDARGNLTATIHPDGTSEQWGYDLEERKIWAQDRRGYRTFFTYDAVGRLRFTVHPDANDGIGNAAPASASDARLADNPRSETQYDLVGRERFKIDPRGARLEFTYEDGCGCAMRRKQMIQHRTAGNLVTHYEYDKAGHVRFVTDPRGQTVETEYDNQGRPRFVRLPATDEQAATVAETRYDAAGRRIMLVDEEGRTTRHRYDALGRLVEVREYIDGSLAASDASLTLAPGTTGLSVTRHAYDELGAQTAQIDALGRVTSYENDSMGRRIKRILPKEGSEPAFLAETLQYNEWGNLWKRTDFAGRTTTFGYDVMDRLKSKAADPAHPSLAQAHAIARIEFDHDASGDRTAARAYNGSNAQIYSEATPRDERGRVDYKDTTGGRLDYSYYGNDLLRDVVSSNSGGVNVGYRYDELNRLAFVDDSSTGLPTRTSGYTYNANGSIESLTAPNGVTHTYGYDALNRLRTLNVTRGAQTLHGYEYKLKPSGHRREVVENATRRTVYAYDDLYRLIGEGITGDAHANNGDVSYSLDKIGNRLGRVSPLAGLPTQTGLSYNARDWLGSHAYNANGSTISAPDPAFAGPGVPGAVTDTYDFEERLITRTRPDGSTIKIHYDADGNRIGKSVVDFASLPLSTTSWLVDTNNLTEHAQVLEESIASSAGSVRRVYTYGLNLLSQAAAVNSQPAVVSYYSYDGRGNVRELTDAAGTVTDRYDYDAFGVLLYRFGSTANVYLYGGEQFDADLGLYYQRARYLDSNSGRFWSMDSFEGSTGEPLSLHKYLFADANPITYSDPSGHFSIVELVTVQFVQKVMRGMAQVNRIKQINQIRKILCRPVDDVIWDAHHLVPLFMGGAGSRSKSKTQDFKDGWTLAMDPASHRGLHTIIRILLKFGGMPASNTKASKWDEALQNKKKTPEDAMQVLLDAARIADVVCKGSPGYKTLAPKLRTSMKRHGFKVSGWKVQGSKVKYFE